MSDKKEKDLNLDSIKESSSWDTLTEINNDTITELTTQIALVVELRAKAGDAVTPEISTAFDGLLKSFKDLMEEAITLGTKHSKTSEEVVLADGRKLQYPIEFYTGGLEDDDTAMAYINVASSYMSIQDRSTNLIALGWVDLFVKLKLPVDELTTAVKSGLIEVKDTYNGK